MTTIDQRILIPAPPDVVWAIVSNIDNNVKWQIECRSVSHLSSRRSGPGVRWRTTGPGNREQVQEITAWYDGLGYEYTVVDGLPLQNAKGRVRLQEIPEGTIVQWSFSYEAKGLVGGLRNSLATRRKIETAMVESLKNLWRYVNQNSDSRQVHEAKSLMRDALDYEARKQYKPRHPSAYEEHITPAEAAPLITEPPISDEDTRPRPAVQVHDAVDDTPLQQVEAEALWLAGDEASSAPSDVEPVEAVIEEIEPDTVEPVTSIEPDADAPVSDTAESTSEPVSEAIEEVPEVASDALPAPSSVPAPQPASSGGADASIWEIFGIPRPSEIQMTPSVSSAAPLAQAAPEAEIAVTDTPRVEAQLPVIETSAIATPDPMPEAQPEIQQLSLTPILGWRTSRRRSEAHLRHRR